MKMYSGRQGKTLVHAHARLHMLEQQHWYTQLQNQRHTKIRQRKNGDAASIQTAPALRSETAEGLDAKRLSFCNNYPSRERRHVFVYMGFCVCVCVCACACVCVCVCVVGVYSCNIHPHCESPDLTALLILLYVTEPVHLVQCPPNTHTHTHTHTHTQPSQHHTPLPSCLSLVEPCSVQISSPALQACLCDAGPAPLSSFLPHWLKIL